MFGPVEEDRAVICVFTEDQCIAVLSSCLSVIESGRLHWHLLPGHHARLCGVTRKLLEALYTMEQLHMMAHLEATIGPARDAFHDAMASLFKKGGDNARTV